MSPNPKFHTPANPHTCAKQTHESNGRFLDEAWWAASAFEVPPSILLWAFVIWKVSLWHAVDRFRWHLSIREGLSLTYLAATDHPVFPRNWQFTIPFCSGNQERHSFCATLQCQIRARLGRKKPTRHPWSLKRERTLGRRNGLHSFHCMHYALHVSRAFGVPHLFARGILMNSPHYWKQYQHKSFSLQGLICLLSHSIHLQVVSCWSSALLSKPQTLSIFLPWCADCCVDRSHETSCNKQT